MVEAEKNFRLLFMFRIVDCRLRQFRSAKLK